jgi:hypothetical protein
MQGTKQLPALKAQGLMGEVKWHWELSKKLGSVASPSILPSFPKALLRTRDGRKEKVMNQYPVDKQLVVSKEG